MFRKQREEKKWAVRRKGAQRREDGNARNFQAFSPDGEIFRYVIGVMGVGKKTNLLAKIFQHETL